jgi:hypothetical protein
MRAMTHQPSADDSNVEILLLWIGAVEEVRKGTKRNCAIGTALHRCGRIVFVLL